jgi:hypothetical protein
MPWVRFDDQFPIHRKVDRLTDAAYRLHTSAIFWCARNLTDGFVSEEDLDGVTARVRTPPRFAAECVKRDVWHHARQPCPSEKCPGPVDNDGWVIHDYWEYQPSKAQVMKDREATARRQANWRARRNGSSNGVTDDVTNAAPSRPAPKEAGRGRPVPPQRPPWCGQCDERTRLTGEPPGRCLACHPLAPEADVIEMNGYRPAQEGAP